MRTNLPITRNEVRLQPGRPIVTKTDPAGIITYANDSFVEISGFTRAELIGENHNIVRHPDMPPAAFADMWQTIAAGQPWRGLVKNRTKSGDFYWVEAFVTPIVEQGRIIGFMSVRNPPDEREVRETEALYAAVREGRASLPTTRIVINARPARLLWPLAAGSALLGVASASLAGLPAQLLAVLAGGLGVATAAYAQHALVTPLSKVSNAICAIDEGRLGERLEHRGAWLSPLILKLEALRIHLRSTFSDVSIQAKNVAQRSHELDTAVQALVSSSATQNDRILDIASAMDQMTASVGEISSHMTESTQAVRSTEGTAHDAITDMEQAVAASDSAASVATASQARIVDMNQSIGRITELTNIIRDIADQTNLLALNAAIEAARAGEQGRGFAVVADEVRKLAEKTASSTADISRVVDEIIQKSRNAVDTMDSVSAQVRKTASGIGLSGERLREIWTLSHTATEHTQSIENMLHQQTDMTTQVTNNINQISAVIEATSGNVNTVGQASAQLHNTASELRELIKHLEKALV